MANKGNARIHPHKFALWVSMASIVMMFAGLTSAYIVRKAQGNWLHYDLPVVFWISTVAIVISSFTMILGIKAFKSRERVAYRRWITLTLILGLVFSVCQYMGFSQLYDQNIRISGNPSESFLFIIAGLHVLHVLGGIVALLIVFFRAFSTRTKHYNATGLEIVGSYWHFVDILWIYLFIFFLVNQ